MTAAATGEGPAAAFVAVDRCSAECVGIHASPRTKRRQAREPIRQAVPGGFGAVGEDVAGAVSLRHGHGSRYMSADFRREARSLGAGRSPAFARAPEGDGRAGRSIRTPKENLLRVRRFEAIEERRPALLAFRRPCDEHGLIERHGHQPPATVRGERTVNLQSVA